MGLRFFVVSVMNPGASEQELNGFLASHKVVSIERKLIDQGVNYFWAICVDYLSHALDAGASNSNLSRSRVDCKAILPPQEFTVYSQLRDKRKELAQFEAVPVVRCSPTNSWHRWCNDAVVPRATWRKSKGSAKARSRNTPIDCCPFCCPWRPGKMRRAANLVDRISEPENLRLAFYKAACGRRGQAIVRQFAVNVDCRISSLSVAIGEGTFPVGRFQQFLIRDPKERVITAPCFEERVLPHAIMNVCEPAMDRWLIDDTLAVTNSRRRTYRSISSRARCSQPGGGVPFLGCRIFPTHVELNGRSKRRWCYRVRVLQRGERLRVLSSDEVANIQARAFSSPTGCLPY